MSSTFFGLNVALSGVLAQRRALDTVSHNLSNASTEGYSRQRVEMQAAKPFPVPSANTEVSPGQLGTGVQVMQHVRLRDQAIDLNYRTNSASFGQFEARSSVLTAIDTLVDEPGSSGLASLLQAFWAGWQSLSTQPESPAVRQGVREAGQALADGIQDLRAALTRAQTEADDRITLEVARVNDLAAQIVNLNKEIAMVIAVGQTPNDLRDLRDKLIDEVSSYTDVAVTELSTGKVSVAIGSQLLVDGATDTVNALAIDAAGNATVGGIGTSISAGRLRGFVDLRDTVIGGPSGYLARLDTFAASLISSVNTRHAAGFGLDAVSGRSFFAGADASDIAIDAAVLASTDAIAASDAAANLPGGSDNAVALAQIQFLVQTIGSATTTIDGYYDQLVASIGVDTDQSRRLAQVQEGVLAAARARREAVSGVNIDEEMADMIRFQKSYNAAARMITTVDEMLETIVNRMGLVGR